MGFASPPRPSSQWFYIDGKYVGLSEPSNLPFKPNWGPSRGFTWRIVLPYWLFVLPMLAIVFFVWRWRDLPAHACLRCGYDTTGNVSGRCPECGTEIVRREVRDVAP